MRQRSLVKLGVPLLAGALALSACGSRGNESAGGGGGGGGTKTAKIGVIAPLSGDLSALGLGIKNSVDLAIKQANDKNAIPGWKLQIQAEDDTATPDVGRAAATKLASDKEVVGVVGTLNSSVAQSVQPVLDRANIVMVSPANTNPSLTQGNTWQTSKKRLYKSYFRTATTDAVQGPFGADYLFKKAGIKSVATVHDKKTYGQGLVGTFTARFKQDGGQVVSAQTINPGDKDFSAVINKIAAAKPQAVYYGGEFPEASLLSAQMKAKGLTVPLMGGDGIFDPTYIKNAGASSANDLATSVGAPTDKLDAAKAYVDAYKAAGYKDPFGAYGAYAYDSAQAIIEALKVSLKDAKEVNDDVRKATVDAMSKVSFDGVTGKVSFDEFGDTTNKTLTVYKVQGGKWAPVETGSLEG